MDMQQVVQPKLSSNGYDRHRTGRDPASKSDDKLRIGKINPPKSTFEGRPESASHDRLVYMATCLIGHQVEVQMVDGSIFSGVFHATHAEDFGIVLKMARLIKDGSRRQTNVADFSYKHPAQTFIIPSKDFVQVTAKGVPVTKEGLANELQHEKLQELLTDSCISQSRQVDVGRELKPWIPDEDDLGYPELENVFDSPWQRGWDQFEANATLFGVKSTFKEELYTTKLERGPRMRELEREASRIAKEIEGEDTLDLHLAEERGIQFDGYLDIDEETRFSSVRRQFDDSGYDEMEDRGFDSWNSETFGGVSSSAVDNSLLDANSGKTGRGPNISSRSPLMEEQSSLAPTTTDVRHPHSKDDGVTERLPKPNFVIKNIRANDSQSFEHPESCYPKEDKEKKQEIDKSQLSEGEDPLKSKKTISDATVPSPNATTLEPSHPSSRALEKSSSSDEPSDRVMPPNTQGTSSSHARPGSSASSTSDHVGAPSTSAGQGLSSSSSRGSLASEKSTLNPHAKEFKLNPNAKSFVPSQPPLRPSSPIIPESSFYYPPNMAPVTQMHGMPVGIGVGGSFPSQPPVMFNPQAPPPMPPPYYHRNAPQYGQQMIVGQQHMPMMYMPTYPPEMPYKGREF